MLKEKVKRKKEDVKSRRSLSFQREAFDFSLRSGQKSLSQFLVMPSLHSYLPGTCGRSGVVEKMILRDYTQRERSSVESMV